MDIIKQDLQAFYDLPKQAKLSIGLMVTLALILGILVGAFMLG